MKYLIVLCFLFKATLSNGQEQPLTVIGNQKGVSLELRLSELKSIFKAERQKWADNTPVVLAMIKVSIPLGASICYKLYNMSPENVMRFWLGLQFAGKVDPPVFFLTVNELQAFVSQTPGAIGIIDNAEVIAGIRIVLIDGKKSF